MWWKIFIFGMCFESRADGICRWIKCGVKRNRGMKNDSKVGLSTRRMGFHVPTKERPGEFAFGICYKTLIKEFITPVSFFLFLFSFSAFFSF